jgi:hypothetical protein
VIERKAEGQNVQTNTNTQERDVLISMEPAKIPEVMIWANEPGTDRYLEIIFLKLRYLNDIQR